MHTYICICLYVEVDRSRERERTGTEQRPKSAKSSPIPPPHWPRPCPSPLRTASWCPSRRSSSCRPSSTSRRHRCPRRRTWNSSTCGSCRASLPSSSSSSSRRCSSTSGTRARWGGRRGRHRRPAVRNFSINQLFFSGKCLSPFQKSLTGRKNETAQFSVYQFHAWAPLLTLALHEVPVTIPRTLSRCEVQCDKPPTWSGGGGLAPVLPTYQNHWCLLCWQSTKV